ncbi:MAG: hypothetical protein HOV80_11410 [Polyangiaceae bacterium]|nr:hypothetical protein [Polyangiaceae bacterium]
MGHRSVIGWALTVALAPLLGACAEEPTEQPADARLGQAEQAIEQDLWIPADRPSAPPLTLVWTTTIGTPALLTSLSVRVRNTTPTLKAYTLQVKSFGLDHRTVTRSLGSFEVSGNQTATYSIPLADLPIKSVSHSSELTVEATLTHEGQPLVLSTPSAFVHFASAGARAGTVYGFDALQDTFKSGLIGDDGFDLEGTVLVGSNYLDIDALREREGLVDPDLGPVYLANGSPDWPLEAPPGGWYGACPRWVTSFVDDSNGDYANGLPIGAAWARAEIRKASSGICASVDPSDCSTLVWAGRLDDVGCARFNAETSTTYFIKVYTDVGYSPSPQTIPFLSRSQVKLCPAVDSNPEDCEVQALVRSFTTPASSITTSWPLNLPPSQAGNAGAVASRLLALDDLPNGKYDMLVNKGCPDSDPDTPATDSCAAGDTVYIGPQAPNSDVPADVHWKNVIGHELGHTVQKKVIGYLLNTQKWCFSTGCVPDDPADPLSCHCEHIGTVDSINQLHCMQSSERTSAANVEGFGHFFAAKLWNDPTESDCEYNYYKEFRNDDGSKTFPPMELDCRSPAKWRNNHCFNAERGTEYDWMQFFWSLNTVGANKISLNEIGLIHQTACGGYCTEGGVNGEPHNFDMTWTELHDAAALHYGGLNEVHVIYLRNTGDAFGVSELP